jgi:hypothetical protein
MPDSPSNEIKSQYIQCTLCWMIMPGNTVDHGCGYSPTEPTQAEIDKRFSEHFDKTSVPITEPTKDYQQYSLIALKAQYFNNGGTEAGWAALAALSPQSEVRSADSPDATPSKEELEQELRAIHGKFVPVEEVATLIAKREREARIDEMKWVLKQDGNSFVGNGENTIKWNALNRLANLEETK